MIYYIKKKKEFIYLYKSYANDANIYRKLAQEGFLFIRVLAAKEIVY